jgi:FkbM family methyltransferase
MFELAVKTNAGNKNVTIKNMGLFDAIGESSINITANYLSSSINNLNQTEVNSQIDEQKVKFALIEKQAITTSTLDEQTKDLKEILLIKLDTQGTELTILKHGKTALKKTHLLLIEMSNHNLYEGGAQYYEVDAFLRAEGFNLIDIIITYRPEGIADEYDAIYENKTKW